MNLNKLNIHNVSPLRGQDSKGEGNFYRRVDGNRRLTIKRVLSFICTREINTLKLCLWTRESQDISIDQSIPTHTHTGPQVRLTVEVYRIKLFSASIPRCFRQGHKHYPVQSVVGRRTRVLLTRILYDLRRLLVEPEFPRVTRTTWKEGPSGSEKLRYKGGREEVNPSLCVTSDYLEV